MKNYRYLETVASVALMLSKYFLAVGSVLGWWFSMAGYILTAVLNERLGLKIAAMVVTGMAILSGYGLYKWSHTIVGLQPLDFAIIIVSSCCALILIIIEAKHKRPFWVLQSILTITFSLAFILLGLKMEIGWYALLIGHSTNIYLYYQKKAYIIVSMQIISIIIVLFKLIG